MIISRGFVRLLPRPLYKILRNVLIVLAWPVMINKRKLAIDNLQKAFKQEKSEKEMKVIAAECFNNIGRGMIDLLYYIDRPDEIKNDVRIEGKEHLDNARAKGNGAILVSAHYGYFILLYLRMVLEGYSTNVIMRRVRDEAFEEYISNFRDEQGLKTIYDLPPKQCVGQSLKALRNNEILIILLDQNYGGDGRIFVDFFGAQAATATGPFIFAKRTGAAILPTFIMRDGEDSHKIVIQKAIDLEIREDNIEETKANIAKLTKIIEAQVRENPQEWGGWMHKRWKARSKEEQAAIDALAQKNEKPHKIEAW